ncbi:MAG: hypothetical protein WKF37_21270, partial [Bryobacteraceae bacterium]
QIRIGCPPSQEDSCVHAGDFLDFFRRAGWRVEGNSVQRVTMGKPEAGILLFLHGSGQNDPNDPNSGLWTTETESVKTVEAAFKKIGLRVGHRAAREIPEGIIAIHFGYNAIVP